MLSLTNLARLSDRERRGLSPDADDTDQDLELEVTFHGDYTQGMRVATAGHPRAYVDVLPVGAAAAPGRLRNDGAVLAYEGAYPRVTSAFGATSTRVEEILVAQRPEDVPTLRYVMRNGEDPIRWDENDRGGLQAFTEEGRALYALVPPEVIDAKGKHVSGRWDVVERAAGQVTIEAKLSLDGLSYPLAIDPTFEVAQWTTTASNTNATARGAAAVTYNSGISRTCIVVFGGLDSVGLRNDVLLNCNSTWAAPAATSLATQTPTPRAYAGIAQNRAVITGDLYVFGGHIGNDVSNELYKLTYTTTTPRTVSWTKLTPTSTSGAMPRERMMHGFAWARLPSGSNGILMWGGVDGGGNALTDMWSYDPTANAWSPIACGGGGQPACPPALYGQTIVPGSTTDLTIYQLGGYSYTTGNLTNEVWTWTGSGWNSKTVNSAFLPTNEYDQVTTGGDQAPPARYVALGARTEQRNILVGGGVGSDGLTVNSDLWVLQAPTTASENRWQRLGMKQSTAAIGDLFVLGKRESPVAAYDETNKQVVIFGGTSTGDGSGALAKTLLYKSQSSSTQGNAKLALSVQKSGTNYLLTGTITGSPSGHEEAYFLQRINGVWSEITGSGVSDCFTSASPNKLQSNKPCTVPVGSQTAFAVRARDNRYVIGGSGSGSSCNLPTTAGAQLPCNPSSSFQATQACLSTSSATPTCTNP